MLEDLQGIHVEPSVEVVTGDFPTCWEMEVMDNGSAEDEEGENEDVYARYVKVCDVLPRAGLNLIVLLVSGFRAPRWPWASREATQEHRYVYSNPLYICPRHF